MIGTFGPDAGRRDRFPLPFLRGEIVDYEMARARREPRKILLELVNIAIDTGSTVSFMEAQLVKTLSLKTLGDAAGFSATGDVSVQYVNSAFRYDDGSSRMVIAGDFGITSLPAPYDVVLGMHQIRKFDLNLNRRMNTVEMGTAILEPVHLPSGGREHGYFGSTIPGGLELPLLKLILAPPGEASRGVEVTALVDTGAEFCACDEELVRSLALPEVGESTASGIGASNVPTKMHEGRLMFKAAGHTALARIAARPLRAQGIDMLLGWNVLIDWNVYVSQPRNQVVLAVDPLG